MTVKNLFILGQFINSKGFKASHDEINEPISFGMAFGLSWSDVTNNEIVQGQFIVLESVSEQESDEIKGVLRPLMSVSDFLYHTWFDYYNDGKYRIIIKVSESK